MTANIKHIAIKNIRNIPNIYEDEKAKQYAETIKKEGYVFPPIQVRKATHCWWLLDGAHRIKACEMCNLKYIEAELILT